MIASSCSGSPNQQWNYVNGQIQGLTANGIITCLDVAGGASNKPGALVVLNQCSNAISQQRAPVQGVSGGIATNPDFARQLASIAQAAQPSVVTSSWW